MQAALIFIVVYDIYSCVWYNMRRRVYVYGYIQMVYITDSDAFFN